MRLLLRSENDRSARQLTSLAAPSHVRPAARIQSVDILRGVVMILMAIDHTRDYVHAAAMSFRPEDLSQTTTAIFLTRIRGQYPAFSWARQERGEPLHRRRTMTRG